MSLTHLVLFGFLGGASEAGAGDGAPARLFAIPWGRGNGPALDWGRGNGPGVLWDVPGT